MQEQLTLTLSPVYGMEGVALRLWNAYGPGQALSNPYTGVLAIFASRIANGNRPLVFEDGAQRRDFVHVSRTSRRPSGSPSTRPEAAGGTYNIGSGEDRPYRDGGRDPAGPNPWDGRTLPPEITGKARTGDVRHNIPGHRPQARRELGYAAATDFSRRARRTRRMGGPPRAGNRARPHRGSQARARSPRAGGLTAGSSNGVARPTLGGRRPVLVTGGAGFIGSNIADRLAREGHDVLVYDVLARPGVERNLAWLQDNHPERVSHVVADVRDGASLADAAGDACAVFHMAAQVAVTTSLVDPLEDFDVNVRATFGLLEALRRRATPAPLVFASTNKVYGDLADVALDLTNRAYRPRDPELRRHGVPEARPLDFHTPYGCSKGAADQYVIDYARSFGVPTAVLRMSCIYGQRQMGTEDQGWVAHFAISALEGDRSPSTATAGQVRDIMDVRDAVDAYMAAWRRIDAIPGRAFNLGGGSANAVSLRELIDYLGELTGRPVECDYGEWRFGDQRWFVADARAARAALGLPAPTGWREGVATLVRWLATERGLPLPPALAGPEPLAAPVRIAERGAA